MKIDTKSWQIGCLAGVILSLAAVQANAAFSSNTFDDSSSFQAGSPNYNPPPISARFDYGTSTAQLTESVSWNGTHDNTGNGGGSVKLSWQWNSADGAGASAFTFDLSPDGNTLYSDLQFDLYLDPSSTQGTYQGNPSDYGYFQVATRDGGYGFNGTTLGQSLLNPGVWQHFDVPLTGSNQSVRALTFQDYNDQYRNITGTEIIYIDNLTLTVVPEPGSLALLGLAVPGLAFVARRYRKSA